MEYLTTHDLVWINTTITGEAAPYNYVTLEAAMAGQYSYGDSTNVPGQAANLLSTLLYTVPFGAGNTRTAFIATLTFLNANGHPVRVGDEEAARIVASVAQRQASPVQAVLDLTSPAAPGAPVPVSLRKLITLECNTHQAALKLLAEND